MKNLFDLMKKKRLLSAKDIVDFCNNQNFEEVVETVSKAFAISNSPNTNKTSVSVFNFSASLTLSGGDYPCESPDCRLAKVADLAKFSTIYSDCTTIFNPFDFIYYFLNEDKEIAHSHKLKIRREATVAFLIILELWPLIDRDLIKLSRTIYLVCKKCKQRSAKIYESIKKDLDEIAEDVIYPIIRSSVELEFGKKWFHLAGIKGLVGEDFYFHYKTFPEFLLDKSGKRVKNIDQIRFSNPLMQKILHRAINSLIIQKLGTLDTLTRTYLTNSSLERIMLEKMGKQSEDKAFSFFVKDLPVIQGILYEYILEIRESYPEEFKSFQDEVAALIAQAHKFETQDEFNKYVKGRLDQNIADLKKIQEEGRRKLVMKGLVGGSFLGAAITASVITNADIPSLLAIAQAYYSCDNLLSEAEELEQRVKKSPSYFYYKLFK